MNLRSDNETSVAPEIIEAIAAANAGSAPAYGADTASRSLNERFSELFERPVEVFPVCTGTAANALSIAHLSPGYGAVFCHRLAHVLVDECGAPEFFSGGARMIGLPGDDGRISPEGLRQALEGFGPGGDHDALPAVLSVTQATECGTRYTPDHLQELGRIARDRGLRIHMDGARFANAVAASGLSPAQLSANCGVDVLSFGTTKNGTLGAEAVVFFNPDLARGFGKRRMKAGQLLSRMRFVSAQLLRYLDDALWLQLAGRANAAAARLANAVRACPGADLVYPVEANELFVTLAPELHQQLREADIRYHAWPGHDGVYRWVTAHDTPDQDLTRLESLLAAWSAAPAVS